MAETNNRFVKDPVCGMTIERSAAAATLTHDGRDYYFCSAICEHTFRRDPAAFTENAPPRMSMTMQ